MHVGMNLHPYLEHLRVRSPEFHDCVRRAKTIDVDLQITTVVTQRIRLRELARHHAHGVEDVGDSRCKKLRRFFQCRYGDAARARSLTPNEFIGR